ncbi:glycosyltransferase family 2 protein [Gloeocapsa sp. PCC 73106]|uniref:glycosyltransferase family 2 protein n=1 Tax=Gloeocapsa sp. PCC 73106 TaxID=102232 RepID=UPI0002AC2539|nr:glycosyltransferase [Gloeocapsa sp. PCC 73106]ELR97384.1 putative glycosyltransferase [Gloeocapsa sp. PCC 73106]
MLQSTISIIIPVYNGGEAFTRCLTSLKNSKVRPLEIIVVADGDTDGSGELAEKFGAKVLRNNTSKGPATARNKGAAIARGDILLFIDADVTIYPDTLAKVAQVFESEPDLTALIGSYDDQPGALNFLSQYRNLFHHYNHQIAKEEASTFWGACGGIKREVFLEMGGFDESYRRPCIEDVELGYRLKAAGYRIRLCKEIHVKHLKHWTPYSMLRADFFYRALPWTELIHRQNYLPNDLNLQWSSRLSVLLVYSLLAVSVTGFWTPSVWIVAILIISSLLTLNAPVYQFFWEKRGFLFTLRTLPWHWLYYFYSGLGFALGTLRYWLFRRIKQA